MARLPFQVSRVRGLRLGASAAAFGLGITTACAVVTPAAAEPPDHAAVAVERSQTGERTTAARIGRLEAQLAAGGAQLSRLEIEAARAAESYNGARFRLAEALAHGADAKGQLSAARKDVGNARKALGKLAAAVYMSGGDFGGVSAYLSADGPQDLLDRAAALDRVSNERGRALRTLRAAEVHARILDRRARARVAVTRRAAREVTNTSSRATAAFSTHRKELARLEARRELLIRDLAVARRTTLTLERARQQGLERAREARAKADELRRQQSLARAAHERKRAEEAARAKVRQEAEQRASDERRVREVESRKPSPSPSPSPRLDLVAPAQPAVDQAAPGPPQVAVTPAPVAPPPPEPPAPAPIAPAGTTVGTPAGAAAAIAFASAQIGKPYAWGTSGPATFDCSGLVMSAWHSGGVPLPHYSVAQFRKIAKVAVSEMRPGDLVFFGWTQGDPTTIFHVGLYIGDGQMIEAPYTGQSVRISSIYRASLFGAGRP